MATDRLGICLSLEKIAPSQYGNYNFNSFCKFGDRYLGANEDGIFVLGEDDLDNLVQIEAFFRLLTTDFGLPSQKRIRSVHVGFETDGTLKITVGTDEENEVETELVAVNRTNKQHSQKVPIGRDLKGRYWELEIRNVDGADFSVDSIIAYPIILGNKPESP